ISFVCRHHPERYLRFSTRIAVNVSNTSINNVVIGYDVAILADDETSAVSAQQLIRSRVVRRALCVGCDRLWDDRRLRRADDRKVPSIADTRRLYLCYTIGDGRKQCASGVQLELKRSTFCYGDHQARLFEIAQR